MEQYIKLNNESFKVRKVKGELYPARKTRRLGDCYNNPSEVKCDIYNFWLKWYKMSDKNEPFYIFSHFTIHSYNYAMFTLQIDVYVRTTNNFIGKLYITKTRQEFWAV